MQQFGCTRTGRKSCAGIARAAATSPAGLRAMRSAGRASGSPIWPADYCAGAEFDNQFGAAQPVARSRSTFEFLFFACALVRTALALPARDIRQRVIAASERERDVAAQVIQSAATAAAPIGLLAGRRIRVCPLLSATTTSMSSAPVAFRRARPPTDGATRGGGNRKVAPRRAARLQTLNELPKRSSTRATRNHYRAKLCAHSFGR